MSERNAQLSIFVLIGVILLAILIFLINVSYNEKVERLDENPTFVNNNNNVNANLVNEYVDACLKRQTDHAYDWVLMQNGYYETGKYHNLTMPTLVWIDYLTDDHMKMSFGRENIAPSMKVYLDDTLRYCFDNFTYLENEYLINITTKEPYSVDVKVYNESVVVNLYYDIVIKDFDETTSVSNFMYKIDKAPISLIEKDVNTMTDAIILEAQNSSSLEYEHLLSELVNREGFNMNVLKETNSTVAKYMFLFEYKGEWKHTIVPFYVEGMN